MNYPRSLATTPEEYAAEQAAEARRTAESRLRNQAYQPQRVQVSNDDVFSTATPGSVDGLAVTLTVPTGGGFVAMYYECVATGTLSIITASSGTGGNFTLVSDAPAGSICASPNQNNVASQYSSPGKGAPIIRWVPAGTHTWATTYSWSGSAGTRTYANRRWIAWIL